MIVFLLILLVCLWAAQRFSLRWALKDVAYHVEASRSLVEPEEIFTIRTTVENNKALPVMFLSMEEKLPRAVQISAPGAKLSHSREDALLTTTFYLMPYQRYEKEIDAAFPQRGRYLLRGCTLRGGDFLGIADTVEYYHTLEEIVVVPRRVDSPELSTTLGGFLGDISVNRFIMEDPVLTIGFRDYTGREAQKTISWTQSARFGRLMVKNFDHTLDLAVTVVLNVEVCPSEDTSSPQNPHCLIEDCFSLARAACEALEEKGIQYRFLTNATAAGALGHWSSISEGLGAGHLGAILEGMGRATYDCTCPFGQTLEQAARSAEQGRCHIVVTPQRQPWEPQLQQLGSLCSGTVCVLTPQQLSDDQRFSPNDAPIRP